MPASTVNINPFRADYQKISQRFMRDRKQPPPIPGNVPPDSRPSLVGVAPQGRDRSDTIVGPFPHSVPSPATYEVSDSSCV